MTIPIFRQYYDGHEDAFYDEIEKPDTLIGCIEVFENTAQTVIDYCNAIGYRTATIHANTETFDCPVYRHITWVIAYRFHNFNIVPPPMREYLKCNFEVLRDANLLQDISRDRYPQLPDEHYNIIERLPSGWNSNSLKDYSPNYTPTIDVNYKRVCWYMGVFLWPGEIPVHPEFHRTFTTDELIALYKDSSDAWIIQNVDLFLAGHWKLQDFESAYHDIRGEWLGENCTDKLNKSFDLRYYKPREHYPHKRTLNHYLFERDAIHKVTQPPNLIEEAFGMTWMSER